MSERLEGLDEELEQESAKAEGTITSFDEIKKKRKPFHYWTVNGEDHKMKLTTGMITKLENKYRTNVMNLITASDIPPLSVMLTIVQAALAPWEHGTTLDRVSGLYDKWLEEGGSQSKLLSHVILPTLAVSGFFTATQAESLMRELEENADLM